jgi:two-component system, NtrC family, sensor kinase
MLGRILRIVLALVLVAVLAVLYVLSQGGDLRRQTQIASDLRNLKDIDTAWNRDVAAARGDPFAPEQPPPQLDARLDPLLADLKTETLALNSPSLLGGVNNLSAAFVQKRKLTVQFEESSTKLRLVVKDLLTQLSQVRQALAQLAENDAKLRARLAPFDGSLVALSSDVFRVYLQGDDTARKALQASPLLQPQSEESYPEALRANLTTVGAGVNALLEQEPQLTELARQIALLPTAARISSLNGAFDREFQTIADEKERFRVYLVFYSAALLVFLGYVMWQLGRSYVKINQANEALKSANETLEHRVADRTKELSQALNHLKESELMLIQTEKMSSLGQMVAGIAHEINTPLAYVKSSLASVKDRLPEVENIVVECQKLLQMLEGGDVPDETLSAQFARVSALTAQFRAEAEGAALGQLTQDGLHGIDEISEIILNLKNFSRLDRSKLQHFNLNEGIESTLVIARNLVKHKTLHRQLRDIPLVECSPSQINQVFLNLITNAAQATDDSTGELTVSTGMATNGQVRVDISDNGHGIPENILAKIFDPFFTTKEVGQGTGLGLSIAYKIVQEHNGRIEVHSKVGKGTTFTVFLPVKALQSQAVAA